MPELYDGTVLPSWMKLSQAAPSGSELSMNDPYLRVGRVMRIHYPSNDSSTNANGLSIEYDVEVEYVDVGGAHTRQLYPRCMMASLFGGKTDFFRYTPRLKTSTSADADLDQGSSVLIMCINGNARQAVIIGGFPHPEMTTETRDDGHNLKFQFNGIKALVNQNGELNVSYNGATKADGTSAQNVQSSSVGTNLTFVQDGSFLLQTPNDAQHFKLDHANRKVVFLADTEERHTVNNGNLTVYSNGVLLGGTSANDAMVMGTTYRNAETACNNTLATQFGILAAQMNIIRAAMLSAGTALAASPAAAAAPFITTAGVTLGLCFDQLTAMQSAIMQLESQPYLSNRHKLDQ